MISKIQRLKLRDVWKHEAHDFTTWMENNIDVVNEALDLSIASVDREQAAGTFSVDLVGETEDGELVIIENQLEKSDHDHLGKLLTYLTSLEAKKAIWIVSFPRPEHVKAISWLNEVSTASFYLVKVEAIKIGDSAPAPLLTLITGPSEEATKTGETKKDLAARYTTRKQFWSDLLQLAKTKTKLHTNISPTTDNWIGTSAGTPQGIYLRYLVRKHDARVGLYLDAGPDSHDQNTNSFNQLMSHKTEIEEAFGETLEWNSMEGSKACKIEKTIAAGGYQDKEQWPDVHRSMVEAMIRLENSFSPFFSKIIISKKG